MHLINWKVVIYPTDNVYDKKNVSLLTVSEEFESVFGPATEVKEFHITPVQEGNLISVVPSYLTTLYETFSLIGSFGFTL